MYKLLALLGPHLFKFLLAGGGLALVGYLTLRLRLRPYVLLICAFVFYAPMTKELGLGFGAGLNPSTFMIAVLALAWLGQSRGEPIRTPLKMLLILWIVLNALSILMTGLAESGPYFDIHLRLLKRMVEPVLLFFFTLAVREEREIRGVIVSICAAVVMAGAHAYVQGIAQIGRVDGLLGHPNLTMAFLSAYGPIVLAMALSAKTTMGRLGGFLAFYLVVMGIFETGSRMGILALGVACFMVLLFSGNRLVALAGVGVVVLIAIAPQILPERIYKRFQGMVGEEGYDSSLVLTEENPDSDVGSRFAIWRGGLEIIRQHPLTGSGFGTFNREITPYLVDFYGWEKSKSAHNAYIKTAAEIGIPALIVLVAIFLTGLKQAKSLWAASSRPEVRWIARGVFGVTIALSVSNMTTSSFQDSEVMTSFFVLTAIVSVLLFQTVTATGAQEEGA